MKQVTESLAEFKKHIKLNETEGDEVKDDTNIEDLEGMTPEEKKKQVIALEKQGMAVIKKVSKNWLMFKKFAGDKMQNYRDFWNDQKHADETIGQEGLFYNLYDSDYIVGIVKSANGKAELKVYNTSTKETGEFESYITSNKSVIKAFYEFFNGEVKSTMKEVISQHKVALGNKKAADVEQKKIASVEAKKAKLDAFLGESDYKKKLKEDRDPLDKTNYRKYSRGNPYLKINKIIIDELDSNGFKLTGYERMDGMNHSDTYILMFGSPNEALEAKEFIEHNYNDLLDSVSNKIRFYPKDEYMDDRIFVTYE